MLKNKTLFLFKRCDHNNSKILISKDLSFLSIISSIIITRSSKSTIENNSNKDNFDINHSKDVSNRKKSTSIFKALKKKKI